jgi:three-Cys-motif partner protein
MHNCTWELAELGGEAMPAPKEVPWQVEPHTLAKHEIIRKYVNAWVPIMSLARNRKIGIIDGFSGPGECLDKNGAVLDGSPLIMLRALLDHPQREKMLAQTEFLYLFVDTDPRCKTHLEEVALPKLGPRPDGVSIECTLEPFDKRVRAIFDKLDEEGKNAVPMFVLVDPFGFAGVPFDLIARILDNPHSEVMVTFMVDSVNRFLEHPDEDIIEHLESLLGCKRDDWEALLKSANRFDALRALYIEQLGKHARWVRSCRMISKQNRPIYDLVFASNHRKGINNFKEAMWKVDPVGGGSFSDVTANMETIFGPDPDTTPLQRSLLDQFAGRTVTLPEIERFVDETPFIQGHLRRRTLEPMVDAGAIGYVPPKGSERKRAKGTFPKGCQISFPK